MSALENTGKQRFRFLRDVWLAWLISASVFLLLFSFILVRTDASEKTMAYLSSALSFIAACAAGSRAARGQKLNPLLCGLLCATFIVLPLLLCGFLIDRSSMSSDSVLSLSSWSLAGTLVGCVLADGHPKKRARKHPSFKPQGRS